MNRPAPAAIPAAGFLDPPRATQRVFRAVLDALAHPGRPYPLIAPGGKPAALGDGLAAVALTLLDDDVTVCLAGPFAGDAEIESWLAFHTGVRPATARTAAFVVTGPEAADLDALAQGTETAPHTSATVVLDVRGATGRRQFTASGPGIDGTVAIDAPWAGPDFGDQWQRNHARFPLGVDLLAVDTEHLTALPRTTRLAPNRAEP